RLALGAHDLRGAGRELDLLLDLDLVLGDDDQVVLLGAALLFRRAGLIGARVDLVGQAVVIAIRAALQLGRPRLVGALVLHVGDAVFVVVEIRAAVVVLEAVFVLGFVGALVLVVGD